MNITLYSFLKSKQVAIVKSNLGELCCLTTDNVVRIKACNWFCSMLFDAISTVYLKGLIYNLWLTPEIASTYYLCKNSGKDSVDSCLDSPECWEGTESNLELVLLSKLDLDPVAVLAVLLWALLMRELTDSEYFSPKPLICRVSAVWNVKTHFKDNWIKSSH